ncbi:MAG: SusF/SusE family outer membrane protein [Bacteroidales bacterium]|nr:SusF/SusE family outer membrane protein [Bacteroidales bacterium]
MKKNILNSLAFFLVAAMLFVACKKEEADVIPIIETLTISDITDSTAVGHGFVIQGSESITEQGICFGIDELPTVDANKSIAEKDGAEIVAKMSNLEYMQKYYYRAYAIHSGGTLYGDTMSFVSGIRLPVVTIAEITDITDITATTGGNVTNDGGGTIKAGVCWSTSATPTTEDFKTEDGTGIGVFVSSLTDLISATTYYVRAYATNESGTTYSDELSFTTLAGIPVVTSNTATAEETTAKASGEVTYDGGAAITERGICWGISANPTIGDNTVTSAGTIGAFEVDITGLIANTTYHARAYATNSIGTAYGDDMEFATYPSELYMTGDGLDNSWGWTPELKLIPVNGHPELFWKIVWMLDGGSFKFAPQAAWSGGDFGITGTPDADGVYAKGGDNVPVPGTAGYYMVVVDLKNNTVQVTIPQVFGMGDVFGNWTMGANPFTVDNDNEIIKFVSVSGSSNLRMYANATTMNLGGDWWRAEVNMLYVDGTDDDIVFRGNGGDPAAYPVTVGQTISLNFRTGTGSVTP